MRNIINERKEGTRDKDLLTYLVKLRYSSFSSEDGFVWESFSKDLVTFENSDSIKEKFLSFRDLAFESLGWVEPTIEVDEEMDPEEAHKLLEKSKDDEIRRLTHRVYDLLTSSFYCLDEKFANFTRIMKPEEGSDLFDTLSTLAYEIEKEKADHFLAEFEEKGGSIEDILIDLQGTQSRATSTGDMFETTEIPKQIPVSPAAFKPNLQKKQISLHKLRIDHGKNFLSDLQTLFNLSATAVSVQSVVELICSDLEDDALITKLKELLNLSSSALGWVSFKRTEIVQVAIDRGHVKPSFSTLTSDTVAERNKKKEEEESDSDDGSDIDNPESVKIEDIISFLVRTQGVSTEIPKFSKKTSIKVESSSSYVHVHIPKPDEKERLEKLKKIAPVPIRVSDIDPWAAQAFKDFETLNPVQSAVFDIAFKSDKNLLVCAPTGAGKTNIAVMTILREVAKNVDSKTKIIDLSNIKIVYIAPMKALASEIVSKFSKRFRYLRLSVRELTGDMKLTRTEIQETNIIVTTPEKWHVVTNKATGYSLNDKIGLMIFDEIHLLNDERGSVIETLITRSHYQQKVTQRSKRILGLSATLPNYVDVAEFLKCEPDSIFYFDNMFRPVPLDIHFYGIRGKSKKEVKMIKIIIRILKSNLLKNKQMMIFVHARRKTIEVAEKIAAIAKKSYPDVYRLLNNQENYSKEYEDARRRVMGTGDEDIMALFEEGMGVHHAGLQRKTRNLMEDLFKKQLIKVLVTTSTLAWGVNLPAHSVVIFGTQIFDSDRSRYIDVGFLDVQQIFGRAGRPQYDKSGESYLLTTEAKLNRYVMMYSKEMPIESKFFERIVDHLNSEIVLGTVSDIKEALIWVMSSYMFIRLKKNPAHYGATGAKNDLDYINTFLKKRLQEAVKTLKKVKLCEYDKKTGILRKTELGRIAAHYSVKYETMDIINRKLDTVHTIGDAITVLAEAEEFSNVFTKNDETRSLESLLRIVPYPILDSEGHKLHKVHAMSFKSRMGKGSNTTTEAGADGEDEEDDGKKDRIVKVSLLIQGYVIRFKLNTASLISETFNIVQNAKRLTRCFLDLALSRYNLDAAQSFLELSQSLESRVFLKTSHPFLQMQDRTSHTLYALLIRSQPGMEVSRLATASDAYLKQLVRYDMEAFEELRRLVQAFPRFKIASDVKPLSTEVLDIELGLLPMFQWVRSFYGRSLWFHVWVSDMETGSVYHIEKIKLTESSWRAIKNKMMWSQRSGVESDDEGEDEDRDTSNLNLKKNAGYSVHFKIKVPQANLRNTVFIQVISEHLVGCRFVHKIPLRKVVFPLSAYANRTVVTKVFDLHPLPVETAFKSYIINVQDYIPNPQRLFKFGYFNPIQTQVFHTIIFSKKNTLLCAPNGSGKATVARLAVFKVINEEKGGLSVYITPCEECIPKLRRSLAQSFPKQSIEYLVDVEDIHAADLDSADIIVATSACFDHITRFRGHYSSVFSRAKLYVLDKLHFIETEETSSYEVVISRLKLIYHSVKEKPRILGLSFSLSNSLDISQWLDVEEDAHFNFFPRMRPVPLEFTVKAEFTEEHYLPRMESMNKPVFSIIRSNSNKQITVFVSSRRQAFHAAKGLYNYARLVSSDRLVSSEPEMASEISDPEIREFAKNGVGVYVSRMDKRDQEIILSMYTKKVIPVIITPYTMSWSYDLPTNIVIIKGTAYFSRRKRKYVEYPLNTLIQMSGVAGISSTEEIGHVYILTMKENHKIYTKACNSPITIESSLHKHLADHLLAEISLGRILSQKQAEEYIWWTLLFKRIIINPNFYSIQDASEDLIDEFLSSVINKSIGELLGKKLIRRSAANAEFKSTLVGNISVQYHLKYDTVLAFYDGYTSVLNSIGGNMHDSVLFEKLLGVLADSFELGTIPVRQSEEDEISKLIATETGYIRSQMTYSYTKTKTLGLIIALIKDISLTNPGFLDDLDFVKRYIFRLVSALIRLVREERGSRNKERVLVTLFHIDQFLRNPNGDADAVQPVELKSIESDGSNGSFRFEFEARPDVSGEYRVVLISKSNGQVLSTSRYDSSSGSSLRVSLGGHDNSVTLLMMHATNIHLNLQYDLVLSEKRFSPVTPNPVARYLVKREFDEGSLLGNKQMERLGTGDNSADYRIITSKTRANTERERRRQMDADTYMTEVLGSDGGDRKRRSGGRRGKDGGPVVKTVTAFAVAEWRVGAVVPNKSSSVGSSTGAESGARSKFSADNWRESERKPVASKTPSSQRRRFILKTPVVISSGDGDSKKNESGKEGSAQERGTGRKKESSVQERGTGRKKESSVQERDIGRKKESSVQERDIGRKKESSVQERDIGRKKVASKRRQDRAPDRRVNSRDGGAGDSRRRGDSRRSDSQRQGTESSDTVGSYVYQERGSRRGRRTGRFEGDTEQRKGRSAPRRGRGSSRGNSRGSRRDRPGRDISDIVNNAWR